MHSSDQPKRPYSSMTTWDDSVEIAPANVSEARYALSTVCQNIKPTRLALLRPTEPPCAAAPASLLGAVEAQSQRQLRCPLRSSKESGRRHGAHSRAPTVREGSGTYCAHHSHPPTNRFRRALPPRRMPRHRLWRVASACLPDRSAASACVRTRVDDLAYDAAQGDRVCMPDD